MLGKKSKNRCTSHRVYFSLVQCSGAVLSMWLLLIACLLEFEQQFIYTLLFPCQFASVQNTFFCCLLCFVRTAWLYRNACAWHSRKSWIPLPSSTLCYKRRICGLDYGRNAVNSQRQQQLLRMNSMAFLNRYTLDTRNDLSSSAVSMNIQVSKKIFLKY